MRSFNQFIGAKLNESTDVFEITDVKGMSVQDAEKIIDKHWHNKLTYKGIEFFDTIYMKSITVAAEKALDPDSSREGQESYLGYLPEKDLFISGWDTWEPEYDDNEDEGGYSRPARSYFDGSVAYVKVDDKGKSKVVNTAGAAGDMMYGRNGEYDKLKKQHKDLVDLRLD